jgi:polysaccharide export outer membrane protein
MRTFLLCVAALLLSAFARLAPAQVQQEDYRIGAGDLIRVTVYNQPDLLTEVEVSEAGTIGMPLAGDVRVADKTRTEAAKEISRRLQAGGFLKNANVTVRVLENKSQQVAVLGEVAKPGRYPITRPTSVAELVGLAGGITAKGSSLVNVVQRTADGTVKKMEVNINDQLSAGVSGKAILLRAGDTVYVPGAPVFYIYGEVRQPGAYPLAADMTVVQAISVGGGLTVRGTERGLKVERRSEDGRVETVVVKGADLLRPNDVVRVPESWF